MNNLDSLLKNMQKKYGAGSVMSIKTQAFPKIERFPVESPKIADILGGGIPIGKIVELYGPESSGKTSLACYFAGQVQKASIIRDGKEIRKGKVAYIDAEHALDPEYASTFGFSIEDALFAQPDSGEQALDIALDFIESGEIDFIVVDSVAALTPLSELNGEMGDQQMGAQARLMGKGIRKIVASLSSSKCSILFINQIRMMIGISFGSPETTPGGKALKFASSIRLEIRKMEFIVEGKETVGLKSKLKGVKNKTASPMKKQEIDFYFGQGINSDLEWVDFAIMYDVIQKGGAWFTIPNVPDKFQGKIKVIDYLKNHQEEYNNIIEETKIRMHPSNRKKFSKKEDVFLAEGEIPIEDSDD